MKNHFAMAICLITFLFSPKICHAEDRLYFIHIPKTGGTTLRLLLEMQLEEKEIYPYRNCKSAKGKAKGKLISGHFPIWFCKRLDDDFDQAFKVTILREPVQRYLSFLRAKKKADATLPDLESVLRLRQKPRNIYKEGMIDNALCRFLAESPELEGEELLESAKQSLHKLDYVVFFENFTEGVRELFQQMDIELAAEEVQKINTTEWEPVSAEVLDEVIRLNQLDILLYDYAKANIVKGGRQLRLRSSSYDKMTKPASSVDYTFDLPLRGSGWTYRESYWEPIENPTYRWVMDKPASIYFFLETGRDYDLLFNAWSLTCEIFPRVRVNGNEIEVVRLDDNQFSLYRGCIDKEWMPGGVVKIEFFSDRTAQFRDVHPSRYNRNHPPLSIALNRIKIRSA